MERFKTIVILLALVLFAGCLQAGEVKITSPEAGAEITTFTTFSAEVIELPEVVAVEWQLNGRDISGSLFTAPLFSRRWHPAEVFDGQMMLQAIGRDILGNEVARSAPVHFSAKLGPGTVKLGEPDQFVNPLSGTVSITVNVIRPLTEDERKAREEDEKFDKSQMNKTVEAIQIYIDGEWRMRQFGAPTRTLSVDTTRLPNGEHEFMVNSYGWFKGVPPIGMLQTTFTTDNGHVPMALLPRWQTLVLQPGEKAELAPRISYTDGVVKVLEAIPSYESGNAEIAIVDDKGMVEALARGETVIKLSLPAAALLPEGADEAAKNTAEHAAPFTAEVRVVVGLPEGLPHFTRNGRILLDYDPERSVFVRSFFTLSPKYVLDTPGLTELIRDAAVNTCESGFFRNPNDGSRIDTFDNYVKMWDPWFENDIAAPARKLGMGLILSGDDWVRTPNEMKWTASTPWALDVARHIWSKLRDSNTVTAIEMMDEASFLGDSPAPTDGRWVKNRDPLIHDNTLVNFIKAIRSVENYTPISWPVLGMAGVQSAHNWMGDPRYADYASQYWTTMDWRFAYPWSTSGMQLKSDLDRVMIGRFPRMMWDKPQLMLASGCGPYYKKLVEGDHFQVGLDEGLPYSSPSTHFSTQPLYAALIGAAGVRTYSVDFFWKNERARAKLGTGLGVGEMQTGASPFGEGSDRWHALSAAFNMISHLEPYILQPQTSAVALGKEFSVGARRSKDHRLLMAINWSQKPRTVSVNLAPYLLDGVATIERYHVRGGLSSVELLPVAAEDTLTFAPGEFVAWLVRVPVKDKDSVPPAVKLVMPFEPTITGPFTLRVEARDDKELKQVEFFVNAKSLGVVTEAPYELKWDAETALLGEWHGVKVVATDAAGNSSDARAMMRVAPPAPVEIPEVLAPVVR